MTTRRRFVIDTNVYIRATRDDAVAAQLERFTLASAQDLWMHSVVALELLTGAASAELELRTRSGFLKPFEERQRIITPSHAAWSRAGSALARLLREKKMSPGPGIKRSFANDCLIAASAADDDFVLITDNVGDFELLAGILPLTHVRPWPA